MSDTSKPPTASRYVVARADDIPPGAHRIVEAGGHSIGVYNVDGRFYGLLNHCPHQGAELCRGAVVGSLESSGPGCFSLDAERRLVICPWHGWEFELANGQSWFDAARTRVRAYEVGVESGTVIAAADQSPDGRVKGPYVAQTIDVETDDEYVVVALRR